MAISLSALYRNLKQKLNRLFQKTKSAVRGFFLFKRCSHPFGNKFRTGFFYLSRKFKFVVAKRSFAFFKNVNVAAIFRLRNLNHRLKLRSGGLRLGGCNISATATMLLISCLLLGTVPIDAAPVELDYMEYSSDVNAQEAYVNSASTVATGGTITYSGAYKIHTFTGSGTFTPSGAMKVEVFVVAGGGGGYDNSNGSAGGSGIVIVRYPITTLTYSEPSIKTQGSYALKGISTKTICLNKTFTRTVSPTINLSNKGPVKFDMRATRTGSNIKIGIHDSGGTTTEITPNITSANVYQTVTWDISGVSNANKAAIDRIIITIVNADASNTFYIDNFFARNYPNAPSALGQSRCDNDAPIAFGNWTNNLTPKATFYVSDDDVGDDVKYKIQVSSQSSFATMVIDYTSIPISQGTTNYIMTGLSSGSSYL